MATILWPFPVNFGSSSAGHAGSVKYLIIDANGVQRSPGGSFAFTASGVAESAYVPGKYEVSMTIDTSWAYPLDISWEDTIAGTFVPDKLYAGDVLSAIALPAFAAGATGGLVLGPITVMTTNAGATGFGASGSQPTTAVDLRDSRFDIYYPRDTQKSMTIIFKNGPITGRTLTWMVKAQKLNTAPALLTHDNALIGGITLNAAPVTIDGTLYPINQVATLTIGENDFTDPAIFPTNGSLWNVFQLNSPEENGSWGAFRISDEP